MAEEGIGSQSTPRNEDSITSGQNCGRRKDIT